MSKTIAVFASARRNGNTGKLIDCIAEILGIEVIDLAKKDISSYDYEHNNITDDFVPVMEKILDYQKINICIPNLLVCNERTDENIY